VVGEGLLVEEIGSIANAEEEDALAIVDSNT